MAKKKSATSIKSIAILALVSAAFVAGITWASFDDQIRTVIATAATFVIVFLVLTLLNWFGKDDDFKPGEPRLK
jgi:hypothetical protein